MAPHSAIEIQDAETTTPLPVFHRLRRHLKTTPPTPLRREILLTLSTLEAGLLDASVYASLGRVFVANMTGNIILLGIAIADLQIEIDVLPILVSLAAFFVGGLITGFLERWTRQPEIGYTRWFFGLVTFVDSTFNFISTALVFSHVVVSEQLTGDKRLIIFAFL